MRTFIAFAFFFTVFLVLIKRGQLACGVCDPTNLVQCLTTTTYRTCDPTTNLPTGSVLNCPSTFTCSSSAGGCNAAGTVECNCGACNNGFACVSPIQFQFCLGNPTPTGSIYTCPSGQVCLSGNTVLCGTSDGGASNDCVTPVTGAAACNTTGRFPLSGTSCKSYFNCVLFPNSTMVRYDYNCTGKSLFNPLTRQCSMSYACTE